MEKISNNKNYDKVQRERKIPSIIFYAVVGIFLVLGIAAIIILIVFFFRENKNGDTSELHAILIGLAGSLFSAGILLNALGTYLFNNRNSDKNYKDNKRKAVIELIKEFNLQILPLFNFTKTIANSTKGSIKNVTLKIEPTLQIQDEAVKKFEDGLSDKDAYQNALIKNTIVYLIAESNTVSSQFIDYLQKLVTGEHGYKVDKNTVGCSIVLKIYHQRRIEVLNFFENLAIQYMNDMVDKALVDAQFKDVILEAVVLFYYDIYKKEGNASYPSLLMLCEQYKK